MTLELPDDFKITEDIQKATDLLDWPDKHVFISGKAGTGKSTFLTYIRKKFEKRNLAVVAPTGVAALNVGGQTIHSFFKIKPGMIDLNELGARRKRRMYEKLHVLIIDEISMVRADLLDSIDIFLKNNGPKKGEPFGGVQLCLIGDIGQLPPIVTRDDQDVFYRLYKGRDFFHANALKNIDIETVKFKEIFRQTDENFIKLLNRVRNGEANRELLNELNKCHKTPAENVDYVTLTTINRKADAINQAKLDALKGRERTYSAKIKGENRAFNHRTPAPLELTLKIGAFVMILKNDSRGRWVNGTTGTITHMSEENIFVKKSDGQEVAIGREKWEHVQYSFDEVEQKIKNKVVGSFEQFPINLAWAITVHKAQGKTLDHLMIDASGGFFEKGQLYVALSRCRKLENLYFKEPLKMSDLHIVQKNY
ncbi:MAG: ATP-dependent DNA helicase [Alphaproteobacteria bacterium]|nr:MAG: hypothetical protein B6I23_00765 [Rickettsiaceae bacterium 4572_127]